MCADLPVQCVPHTHWEFFPKFFSNMTSKKLWFWLKIVANIYFLLLKPIKRKLGLILEIMKKIARWRHKSEISKRSVKTMIHYYCASGDALGVKRISMIHLSSFCGFGLLFSSQNWINARNIQKAVTFEWILMIFVVFKMLFHFGWKTADQTNKLLFLDLICSSGHPRQALEWYNSRVKKILARNPSVTHG